MIDKAKESARDTFLEGPSDWVIRVSLLRTSSIIDRALIHKRGRNGKKMVTFLSAARHWEIVP